MAEQQGRYIASVSTWRTQQVGENMTCLAKTRKVNIRVHSIEAPMSKFILSIMIIISENIIHHHYQDYYPSPTANQVRVQVRSWPWARLSWQFTLCRGCTQFPTRKWFRPLFPSDCRVSILPVLYRHVLTSLGEGPGDHFHGSSRFPPVLYASTKSSTRRCVFPPPGGFPLLCQMVWDLVSSPHISLGLPVFSLP